MQGWPAPTLQAVDVLLLLRLCDARHRDKEVLAQYERRVRTRRMLVEHAFHGPDQTLVRVVQDEPRLVDALAAPHSSI